MCRKNNDFKDFNNIERMKFGSYCSNSRSDYSGPRIDLELVLLPTIWQHFMKSTTYTDSGES